MCIEQILFEYLNIQNNSPQIHQIRTPESFFCVEVRDRHVGYSVFYGVCVNPETGIVVFPSVIDKNLCRA